MGEVTLYSCSAQPTRTERVEPGGGGYLSLALSRTLSPDLACSLTLSLSQAQSLPSCFCLTLSIFPLVLFFCSFSGISPFSISELTEFCSRFTPNLQLQDTPVEERGNGPAFRGRKAGDMFHPLKWRRDTLPMGTSLTRKRTPLGPCRRPMPKVLGGFYGGGRFLMSDVPHVRQ